MAAKKTFIVQPHGGDAYEVTAENYTFDRQTGVHSFKNGDEDVATLYNVSVRAKQ